MAQRYVSKELTHFVGRGQSEEEEQYTLLLTILRSGWLTHPPHNPGISGNLSIKTGAKISDGTMFSPEVVCFCDIPVEDLAIHMSKYSRFGLSFLKAFLSGKGANPVFYLARNSVVTTTKDAGDLIKPAMNAGRSPKVRVADLLESTPRSGHFDEMLPKVLAILDAYRKAPFDVSASPGVPPGHKDLMKVERFLNFHWFSFAKFFDDGLQDQAAENFYMEREWRVVGNVNFTLDDVYRVILPGSFARRFRNDLPDYAGQVMFAE